MIVAQYTEGEGSASFERKSIGRYLASEKVVGKVALWLVALLTFSYPISAAIPTLFHLPTTPVNIAFRALYVAMSLFLIGASVFKKQTYQFRWYNVLMFAFWICYVIRMTYDFEISHVVAYKIPKDTIYMFAIGNCVLPSFAMMSMSRYIDLAKLEKVTLGILIVSNILILVLLATQIGLSLQMFIVRNLVRGSNETSAINEITISFSGCQLIIMALNKLLMGEKYSRIKRFLWILCIVLGFFNLFAGGSRSPMILFVLMLIYTLGFYFYKHHRFKRFISNFKIFIACVVIVIIGLFASMMLKNVDFALLTRLQETAEDRQKGGKELRDFEQEAAWNDFLSSPIIGHQFVNSYDKTYPHNTLLEALMALGILGGVLFFPFMGKFLHQLFTLPFKYASIFSFSTLVGLSFFVSQFSGSLWSSVDFWALSIFWVNIEKKQLEKLQNTLQ